MKKKLVWLNLALAILVVLLGYRIRAEWTAGRQQELRIEKARVKQPRIIVAPPAAPPAPVTAPAYSDIATKMLFSQDRNPTVVVEAPAPPPPKPMPALPLLHGVMGLPSGIVALMSLKADDNGMSVHVGDKIGDFELAALSQDKISLKWEDKTVTKSVSEMIYNTQEAKEKQSPAAQQTSSAPNPSAPATPQSSTANQGKTGLQVGAAESGVRACAAGDSSPGGTVTDGYRKVLVPTPFGQSCHWEQVK